MSKNFIGKESLAKRWLLYPKVAYYFVGLPFFFIHQYRETITTEVFGYTKKEFGRYYGICTLFIFFLNFLQIKLFDRVKSKKTYLVSILILSTVALQCLFWTKKIFDTNKLFWPLFFIYNAAVTILPSILDKLVIEYLLQNDVSTSFFGSQKVFETIAYVTDSFLMESFVNKFKSEPGKIIYLGHIHSFFVLFACFSCCLLPISTTNLKNSVEKTKKSKIAEKNQKQEFSVKKLFEKKFVIFNLTVLMAGIVRTGLTNHLSAYYKNVLKIVPKTSTEQRKNFIDYKYLYEYKPLSLITTSSVIFELLGFGMSKYIIQYLGLYFPALLGHFFNCVRLYFYINLKPSSLNTGNANKLTLYVILIETLKGLGFGLILPSATQISVLLVDDSMKTAASVIFSGFYSGISFFFSGIFISPILGITENFENYKKYFMVCFCVSVVSGLIYCSLFIKKFLRC